VQVHFGEWRLDPDARQLLRGNAPVHVSPKAFELLKLLVEHRPQALSKADLHAAIWPATFVSEASLAQLVSEIRAAIDDNAHEPRFLRTVHGFGYAFACDALDISRQPQGPATGVTYWLRLVSRDIQLWEGENVLGRDPAATVGLDSLRISRYHARIVLSGGDAILEDLGSKNGTYLNGRQIAAPARLQHGDEIRVGPFSLTFHVSGPGATTETEVHPERERF
jgi:DNA-binding winged helix-turn-helix (wHTH) protein